MGVRERERERDGSLCTKAGMLSLKNGPSGPNYCADNDGLMCLSVFVFLPVVCVREIHPVH